VQSEHSSKLLVKSVPETAERATKLDRNKGKTIETFP